MNRKPAAKLHEDLDALRELDQLSAATPWQRPAIVILLLLAGLVVASWLGQRADSRRTPVVFNSGVQVPQDSGAMGWTGGALEQAMLATLRTTRQIRVVGDGRLPVTATRARELRGSPGTSGADWDLRVQLASMADDHQMLIASIVLAPINSSAPPFESEVVGSVASLSDLASRASAQILLWLDAESLTSSQIDQAVVDIPGGAASEAYGRGLAALSDSRPQSALAHFRLANQKAPDNPAILEALSDVWSRLGYANRAAEHALAALQASEGLSRRRQLELEARVAQTSEDWPRAEQVFGALKEFVPEDLGYRLALARAQIRQNDHDGVAATLGAARALSPDQAPPAIDLVEADYWYDTGDYRKCFEFASRARDTASRLARPHALAEATLAAARCDDSYAPELLREARQMYRDMGNPHREPEILRQLSNHEFAQGNFSTYRALLEEALRKAESLENPPEVAASRHSLAQAYDQHGWLSRGYALKLEVADYQKERGNMTRYGIALENIAISLFKLGRYTEALEALERAAVVFVEIDDKIGIAWLPFRRAEIELRRGNLAAALAHIEAAADNAKERPEGSLAVESQYVLARILFRQGRYDEALETMLATHKIYTEKNVASNIVAAELVLARMRKAAGDTRRAREHVQAAASVISDEAQHTVMTLRAEQVDFSVSPAIGGAACEALKQAIGDQEYRELVLKAKVHLALCGAVHSDVPDAVTFVLLETIEGEAREYDVFEARLMAILARAVLLARAGQDSEAEAALLSARELAQGRAWRLNPLPDFQWLRARWPTSAST